MGSFAVAILLASCVAPMTPEERGIAVDDDIEIPSEGDVLALVQDAVENHYRIDLGLVGGNVYWASSECEGKPSVIWCGACERGLVWSCEEIYVAVSQWTPSTTCGTVLVHEFGHCLHDAMAGTLDTKHLDEEFWPIISRAYVETCELGW